MIRFDCKDIYEICPCLEKLFIKKMILFTTDSVSYKIFSIDRITEPGSLYASKINAMWRYRINLINPKKRDKESIIPVDMFGFRLGKLLYDSIEQNCVNMSKLSDDNNLLYIPTFKIYYDDIDPVKYEELNTKEKESHRRDKGYRRNPYNFKNKTKEEKKEESTTENKPKRKRGRPKKKKESTSSN